MNLFVKRLSARLAEAGSDHAMRAVEELVAHVMGCKPLEIYFHDITPEQEKELEPLVARAEQGEPIQYIIGHVDFRGVEIRCDKRALIPRPETERLIDVVLEHVDATSSSRHVGGDRDEDVAFVLKIADVGIGTGCIALALLTELPNAEVVGVDVSQAALALARENAGRLGLGDRFQALENNLLAGFEDASLDMVVSNPPYVSSGVCRMLAAGVKDYEPQLALDGGEDGLDLIRPLVEQAVRVLRPGGGLFVEIGYDQGPAVFDLLQQAGFQDAKITKDHAGLDRIVSGRRFPVVRELEKHPQQTWMHRGVNRQK